MSQPPRDLDPMARLQAQVPPPPVGAALEAALAGIVPVRTRVPARAFAILVAFASALALWPILQAGPRQDLAALPMAWVLAMGAAFALTGPFLLARAVLPAKGSVLPEASRAGRTAIVVAVGLVLLGLVGTIDAPGVTVHPSSFLAGYWHCTRTALCITLPVLVVGALVLRHLHPMGGARIAAAIGAAGGAWAAFVLHIICPMGGGAHVGLAHGGAAVLGAALGALLFGRLLR